MLYFVWEFLQGIAYETFSRVSMFFDTVHFIIDSLSDFEKTISSISLPPFILSAIFLVVSLAIIDKVRG